MGAEKLLPGIKERIQMFRKCVSLAILMAMMLSLSACGPGKSPPPEPTTIPIEKSDNTGAKVDIYANDKAKEPVSRYLYGKFTEHLGRNIYGGMWAQILNNPGFEGWQYWGGVTYATVEDRMRPYTERLGLPDIMESYDKGIAPWWLAYGRGDVIYIMDTDSFNSDLAQKITVKSLETQQVGIKQSIFLPLHREQDYELSFYARSDKPLEINIAIRKLPLHKSALAGDIVKVTGMDWQRYSLQFKIHETVEKGKPLTLTIGLSGPGTIWLDQMTLFPDDNVKGFDADIVRLTRDSKLSILRWPGGNFVSGYRWEDGIGPMDRRKTVMNRPWAMIEYNYVGTDEFMAFSEAVNAEPLIVVNAGDGTPEEAAEWVEYTNGSVDTKYGALRAENGHPEPYNVVYWEIGNELWGSWQIGFTTGENYAERYEKFYKAMTAVDPDIKVIANGQSLAWNEPLIQKKSDILRSLSLHTLTGGSTSSDADPTEVFESLMAYTFSYARELRDLGAQMAEGVKEPKLAITELQIFTNKRGLPNNQTLSEALFYSGIVNTSIRSGGLVEMITHSAVVNHGGGLRKVREIVYPNPVYYARRLYATQSGTTPVRINVRSPMYTSSDRHALYTPDRDSQVDVPYLDVIAMVNDDNSEFNLILTNRHPQKALNTRVVLHDFDPTKDVRVQTLTEASYKMYMSANTWDNPDEVKLQESSLQIKNAELDYSVPAHSIVLLTFTRK